MTDDRLPAGLWVEAHLRKLDTKAVSYYIVNKGAYASGTVLLKLLAPGKACRLLVQERDLDGVLGWANALNIDQVDESAADDYIRRSIARDPDVWVIEVEDKKLLNPFEEKLVNE